MSNMTEYCEISGSKIRAPDPFKIGDRVRLIGFSSAGAFVEDRRGTVSFVKDGPLMHVKMDTPVGDGDEIVTVSLRQGLKLQPRAQK